ncbi:MAG TPA: hypothetical protein VGS96_18455 [Thermoanaerobaculia bacterium]|jgi:hypothetical protein|nr:hypothetical protein [Thermoanaerobaculia bacterium]
MTRPRIGFLPAFFTALSIAFVIALWLRIRSYANEERPPEQRAVAARSSNATETPRLAMPEASATATIEPPVKTTRRKTIVDLPPLPPISRTPPPMTKAKPVATTPAKPSLFSRIVTPIVNAITGGPSKPQTSSAASSTQPQQMQSSSSRASDRGSGAPDAQKDRTSDTQPPQLIAIGFNPPQVHDGEETVLTIQAVDDLSGVRSISGTIVGPSGAVQGFACQREADTDRYSARITVPKDAADGIWRVNYLSLIDNASNATTLSGAQGAMPATASFRVVSSRPDSQGPTLKAVWIDRRAMKAGEKNTIFVDADDDKSGVNLVSGVLISPAKHARIGFVCRPGTGSWECEVSTPACIDCGEWQLEQVQLQDKANNMTTVRVDNPLLANVRVDITSDRCDATAPTIQALVLDRNNVTNVEDSIINVTATASDDLCGVMSMSGQATGPAISGGAPRLYFSFTPADAQTWAGRITVPKLAAKGIWHVTWIQVLDQAHNLKTYSQGDPALANAVFNVQ